MDFLDMFHVPDTEEGKRDIKWIEKAHIVMWLLKDMSWVNHWRWVGMAAILPTLGLAIKIAYDSRHSMADFVHDVAVCCWISANITWMLGEFFVNDETRPIAKVFFYLGAVVILSYYAYAGSKRLLHAHRLRHQVPQAQESLGGRSDAGARPGDSDADAALGQVQR